MRDTIDMAREAGIFVANNVSMVVIVKDQLERFAALVRADEREACAKVCDGLNFIDNGTPAGTRTSNRHCAAAIRARGNTP